MSAAILGATFVSANATKLDLARSLIIIGQTAKLVPYCTKKIKNSF